MSARRTNKRKSKSLPPNALQYCPRYIAWDKEVREETKKRFRDHYNGRRSALIECIVSTLEEIHDPLLRLQFHDPPIYQDNDTIIDAAFKEIDNRINNWGGVQFSTQFITQFNKTGKTMDKKKFIAGAKNHQDQTSWKVSGNYFFARYLSQASRYFKQYCDCICDIEQEERNEIYRLLCIKYIVVVLTTSIKFHRTKGKTLIRQKTLVKSEGIHIEIENLFPALKVRSFVSAAKRKRKQETNKNTIIAEEFYKELLACCNTLYREQKQKVYDLRKAPLEMESKENEERDVYPEQLMDSDTDIDQDKYEPEESNSVTSAQSTPVLSRRSNHNHDGAARDFQRVNPRNYSVRNEMNRNIHRERQRHRESMIRQRNESNDILQEGDDILPENDRNESVHDQSSFNHYDHRYIGSHGAPRSASYPIAIDDNAEQIEIRTHLMENIRLWREVFALRQEMAAMERTAPYDAHPLYGALDTSLEQFPSTTPNFMQFPSTTPNHMEDLQRY